MCGCPAPRCSSTSGLSSTHSFLLMHVSLVDKLYCGRSSLRACLFLSLVNPISREVQESHDDWLQKSPLSTRSHLCASDEPWHLNIVDG
jgi:hypothetical protein